MVNKFRKKPVEVEAVRWDGTTTAAGPIVEWINRNGGIAVYGGRSPVVDGGYIEVITLEGQMRAIARDWIIRGVQGEFYPCKPDIFEATYEPV